MGEFKGQSRVRAHLLERKGPRGLACPKKWKEKAYETLIFRSWWMFLFLALCFLVYSHAMHKKDKAYLELQSYLVDLQEQKLALVNEREDLLLQTRSQSDPSWIQMILMKALGVVPEGQVKVYFEQEEEYAPMGVYMRRR
jgi:hypothetical protein